MTTTHDEIIARVRKLYSLARGTNEHEAAAAIKAAEQLIQKHRLSQAELESNIEATIDATEGEPLESCRKSLAVWRSALCGALSKNYGCAAVADRVIGVVRVFGRADDVALLRLQYDRVVEQIERLAYANARGQGRSYADSYRKGIVITIEERLKAAKVEAQQAATTQAIVRLDQRLARSDAAMRASLNGARLRSAARSSGVRDADAYLRGREDGKHIHLGDSLGAGLKPKALGAGR